MPDGMPLIIMQRVCLSSVIIGDEDLWTWKEAGGLEGQEIYSRENTVQNKAMEKEALGGGGGRGEVVRVTSIQFYHHPFPQGCHLSSDWDTAYS